MFQNRVTARDERLRINRGVMIAPAYFAGVSGVVVPLPWNYDSGPGARKSAGGRNLNRRASMSKIDRNVSVSFTSSLNGSFTGPKGGKGGGGTRPPHQ